MGQPPLALARCLAQSTAAHRSNLARRTTTPPDRLRHHPVSFASIVQVSLFSTRADQTRFPSLELTCNALRNLGGCDCDYSPAYPYNLTWSSPTTPMTPDAKELIVPSLSRRPLQRTPTQDMKMKMVHRLATVAAAIHDHAITATGQAELSRDLRNGQPQMA